MHVTFGSITVSIICTWQKNKTQDYHKNCANWTTALRLSINVSYCMHIECICLMRIELAVTWQYLALDCLQTDDCEEDVITCEADTLVDIQHRITFSKLLSSITRTLKQNSKTFVEIWHFIILHYYSFIKNVSFFFNFF